MKQRCGEMRSQFTNKNGNEKEKHNQQSRFQCCTVIDWRSSVIGCFAFLFLLLNTNPNETNMKGKNELATGRIAIATVVNCNNKNSEILKDKFSPIHKQMCAHAALLHGIGLCMVMVCRKIWSTGNLNIIAASK